MRESDGQSTRTSQIGRYGDMPIVHTVELLDWATGGPMPEALSGLELPEPAPEKEEPAVW